MKPCGTRISLHEICHLVTDYQTNLIAGIAAETTAEIIADWLEAEYTGPDRDAPIRRAAKRIRAGDWKKILDGGVDMPSLRPGD